MIENLKELVHKLNPICRKTLEQAAAMCVTSGHHAIEIEHWLVKILEHKDCDFSLILTHYQVDHNRLRQELTESMSRFKTGNSQAPAFAASLVELLREALIVAHLEFGLDAINSGAVLSALLRVEAANPFSRGFLQSISKIDRTLLPHNFKNLTKNSSESAGVISGSENSVSALNQYAINLTQLAEQGKIDPVIGREEEVRQLIDILTRRRQNNPILTGEPGVGKTAIVEGLALRIVDQQVPKNLKNVAIYALDLTLLQAGAGIKGEFENRLKSVINEVKNSSTPIILFIDEAHSLIGAGGQAGQADAANILKPALARGELRTIAATTWAEYKKYFEQDAALTRRFQVVKVDEPSEEIAIQMLRGLVAHLEKYHHVRILDEALIAAVRLSSRYISQRQLPDKAISILDTACARLSISHYTDPNIIQDYQSQLTHLQNEIQLLQREQSLGLDHQKRLNQLLKYQQEIQTRLQNLSSRFGQEKALVENIRAVRFALENNATEKNNQELTDQLKNLTAQLSKLQGDQPLLQDCVNEQSIAEVISAWTGVPLGRMISQEISTLLGLEKQLQARIKGQDHAITTIVRTIRSARAQLSDPDKPTGSFLFVGPSGVGKTETALTLAELVYGSARNLTVINLSEFKEEHKVSLLLGSPPGYVGYGEGGILTEAVRRAPYSLVLLDELEKAHSGVQDIFYQVFDKGSLRDGQGRDVNFKNTILILTSNAAGELITKLYSDSQTAPSVEALVEMIRPELLKFFKPAFLGRLTIIPYLPLKDEILKQIIELQLQRIRQRVLINYQAKLIFEPEIIDYILTRCQEAASGGRAIEQLINSQLLPEMSGQFLNQLQAKKIFKKVLIELDNQKKFLVRCK
ncbi:MAG: type VI secretion system ATPase TssH [Proteobacteria bacterium]|nr:type VI secretion system ATPase TssH [Pseudomonadota bacterium]